MILSNFTYDGATIGRGFVQRRKIPFEQGLDGILQKELRGFPAAKCDVIYAAAIAQDALAVDDEYVRGRERTIEVSDKILGIDQDLWDAPRFSRLRGHLRGLIPIRGDRQQDYLTIPVLEQRKQVAVCPLRVRTLRRPKVDDNYFSKIVTQFMKIALQVRQFKIWRGVVYLHGIIIS